MKVLVIGSGGREHALVWKIVQSPLVDKVYCAPGNPGIQALAECVAIGVNEMERLAAFAADTAVDLTVVGPEDPLANGIADLFSARGLAVFGPSAAAARLEGSKAFAKDAMGRYGIPTAEYAEFDQADEALDYVRAKGAPIVIKADGLAAGKGVTVARTVEEAEKAVREAMVERIFGGAGATVVIEECLVGEEASILAFSDGKTIVPMVPSQDHKPVFDGDEGPNTGGMGAYSPAPVVSPGLLAEIQRTVLEPCIRGMAKDGCPYRGVLYAGLMITEAGPKVIEFNVRFGDPETQVVLPRMRTDVVPVFQACCEGRLDSVPIEWDSGACVTVVMASGGYPKDYAKGKVIKGIAEAEAEAGVVVFHAGTRRDGGNLLTNGGRVLNVTAQDDTIASAIDKAYRAVKKIHFEGAHHRTDIGGKALGRLG